MMASRGRARDDPAPPGGEANRDPVQEGRAAITGCGRAPDYASGHSSSKPDPTDTHTPNRACQTDKRARSCPSTTVSLLNIAKQGEHSYPPDTSHRVEHFTALLEHSGGRLCKMDWRFGDYDLVALMEYSNAEAPAALAKRLGAAATVVPKP
jgi:uncharacterized protein with GYD domain